MAGYLIGDDGILTGLVIRFIEGNEWVLGRDPESATIVLEDPSVSRRHVICRKTDQGYFLENLSSTNPAEVNGIPLTEEILLHDGDIVQIGGTSFHFSHHYREEKEAPVAVEEPDFFAPIDERAPAGIPTPAHTRFMLKVISGPNSGAEFNIPSNSTKIIGKDPNSCDLIFQDLTVSKQHAKITIDRNNHAFIEDLKSRNGVIVNGELIKAKKELSSQDLVSLGTTSFLFIDKEAERETIVAPAATPFMVEPKKEKEEMTKEEAAPADWRDIVILKKHLVMGGALFFVVLLLFLAIVSLFKSEPVHLVKIDAHELIQEQLKPYPSVEFTFNDETGKLFLVGHVLTAVDKLELLYFIQNLDFVKAIDDNIVVDEYVWQSFNALLGTNPIWAGVHVHSYMPGKFVLNGYLENLDQYQALADYVNLNFPYLDKLDNRVVVESNLATQITSVLITNGFSSTAVQLKNGEVVLVGRVEEKRKSDFDRVLNQLKSLPGVRILHNYVIMTTEDTSRIDISSQYQIEGFSNQDHRTSFVVIGGRILGVGNIIDAMLITEITPNEILLEKDGLKFKINYNQQ